MAKKSFKSQLIFSYIFLVLIPFSFIAFLLDTKLENIALTDIKVSLVKQASLIESQINKEDLTQENIPALNSLAQRLGSKIQSRLTIINIHGTVIADSQESAQEVLRMENHAARPEVKAALQDTIGENIRYSTTLKIDMLYVALPMKDKDAVVGVIRLALPLEQVRRVLSATRKTVLFTLLFALGLAFGLGTLLSRRIIAPLNKIIYATGKFARGDFSHRIYQNRQDEIGELAKTLNGMAQDIEGKIREIEIQNQQLKNIFQSMVEGIILTDKNGTIVSINPTVEKIFSVTKEAIEGRLFLEAIRNSDIAEIMNRVLQTGEFVSKELAITWPVQRVLRVNASAIFEQKATTGCLLVIHDITEMRRLEIVRSDFVANVSHELKTPLTSIKGFVETLMEGALEDKENARHFLQIILEHTDRLNNLINDLLDLSYLESKEVRLEKQAVPLQGLTDKVLAGFTAQLKKKSLGVKNELSPDVQVQADREKIEQVLTNFIDNAIKFNREKGTIRIYTQRTVNTIKVMVEDSGIGIPAKDLPRIFERFYRVDKARSRELGGTGLGLSIVKHIIELHGGTVGVESSEGLGSQFWFTLPA